MFILPLLLLQASGEPRVAPTAYSVLKVAYARVEDVSEIEAALDSPDPALQRLAVRAIGQLERPSLRGMVVPFARSADPDVRGEAIAALAQMGASFDFTSLLASEKTGAVRAVIYEALGREKRPASGREAILVAGLKDADPAARAGAARGIESLVRLNLKTLQLAAATIGALRQAIRDNPDSRLRQFALLALNAAGDRDQETLDLALRDGDPQVRRLAVIGSKRWIDDPAPMVRIEALRAAGTCERAGAAIRDPSGHVALAAVDLLGTGQCEAATIEKLADYGGSWRIRSHALLSLARVAPEAARLRLKSASLDPRFQVRAYAAQAAKLIDDQPTLDALAIDGNPTVAAAALSTPEHALRALKGSHSGLLLAAATLLKGAEELKNAAPQILVTVQRLTRESGITRRDPRVALIERLGEAGDEGVIGKLRPMLKDRDPEVAALVARLLTEQTGKPAKAETTRYVPEPFPTEAALRSLGGATAVINMKSLGVVRIQLLTEEAPATVATFARLVERGAYSGLTFHRVVPNFVLQGGSPGADEYDALTPEFMRDELGSESHERGTFGISTRGHDTGDGQIFINLVDNWRLDHTYTVFARVISGMEVVDRILEGDVIESIRIERGVPLPRP